eukprot:Gb_32342 [translate_table: standard]
MGIVALDQFSSFWAVSSSYPVAFSYRCCTGRLNLVHFSHTFVHKCNITRKRPLGHCRASMGGGTAASQYAKEMERYAAKESLYLALVVTECISEGGVGTGLRLDPWVIEGRVTIDIGIYNL